MAFRAGLREFGYSVGKDIIIEEFLAPTTLDLPASAASAVAGKPDIIVAIATAAALAAKARTTTIPIVFANVGSPVEIGLVASIGRPGGNVTGSASLSADLAAKRLQMLSEFIPKMARVAILYQLDQPNAQIVLDEVYRAARILVVDVQLLGVKSADEVTPAIASAASSGAQAIYILGAPFFADNARLVAEATRRWRLPSIDPSRTHPDAGGLLSYGADQVATVRRAAYYVDRILKGEKPADLPVEQPMLFELVINKRTADALGLEIPLGLWVQATEIIE